MGKKGVTLIELLIVVALLLGGMVPLLKMIISGLQGTQKMGEITVANSLAQALIEEIKQRKWDENSPDKGVYIPTVNASDVLRYESGEDPANRYTFDDIDDYNGDGTGFTDEPMKDDAGIVLEEYKDKYYRKVKVEYVDIPLGGKVTVSASKTDYKKVTVTVYIKNDDMNVTQSVILANGVQY